MPGTSPPGRRWCPLPYPTRQRTRSLKTTAPACTCLQIRFCRFSLDLEQEPKVLEDLEKHWSDGQFAVLKKALTAAAELGTGLLEATEVVEPNPLHPNESTCYSNLFHCDRDGVYLYIDMAMKQIAQAMEQNKSDP